MKLTKGSLYRRPIFFVLLLVVLLATGFTAWWFWPQQFLRMGQEALQVREYEKAREALARYLSYRPSDAQAHLLAARTARNLREYYEAFEHLRRCREAGGDAEAIDIETSLIGVARGEEPTPMLRQRAEENDEIALVILEVLIQYDLDNYRLRQALHNLTNYLKSRPDDLHALLARGYVWERFLYFEDALKDYQKAVDAYPESEKAHLKLGEMNLIVGTPNKALDEFLWLAKRKPDQPEVLLGLARCYRRLGQTEEANRLLNSLVKRSPGTGEILWELGQLELDNSHPTAAEPWLRKAVKASPFDRRIAHSLAQCLMALGQKEEADKISARVARLDADLRRLDEIRQAVMERPTDAKLRCEGGLIFLRNGEEQEGIRWLRQALRLDPNCQAARDALAESEKKPGNTHTPVKPGI